MFGPAGLARSVQRRARQHRGGLRRIHRPRLLDALGASG